MPSACLHSPQGMVKASGSWYCLVLFLLLTIAFWRRSVAASPSSNPQTSFQSDATSPYTHLSYHGLHVNSASHPPPKFLTLTTIPSQELDPTTAKLFFSKVRTRQWDDVMLKCGAESGAQGGIESCEKDDLKQDVISRSDPCRAARGTMDGRALFDPAAPGCEPLAQLWQQAYHHSSATQPQEQLLSFKVVAEINRLPTSLDNSTHRQDFWLAHLHKNRALWPLSNDGWRSDSTDSSVSMPSPSWDGQEPNRVAGLMEDPHLQRAAKTNRSDPLNGVDITAARWNLGVSLRLPPLPDGKKFSSRKAGDVGSPLLSVHAPIGGQVVWVGTYRRHNAPSRLNDEQGWVICIRDEWGFVWSLFGISPYHQQVWVGQNVPQGHIIGYVSLRPLSPKPRDQEPPADPPEKPPGGDGNPSFPFRFRELRISVSRPSQEWSKWPDPYAGGWQWYNPLALLVEGRKDPGALPPTASPQYIFFARPSQAEMPVGLPEVFASVSTMQGEDERDENNFVTVDGDVEMIIGVRSFSQQSPTLGSSGVGLDPVGIYKLEWTLKQVDNVNNIRDSSCRMFDKQDTDWRVAFEHSRLPHAWPTTTTAPLTCPNQPQTFFSHFLPTFTTGNYPWTRKKYATQFDEKNRGDVFYPFTRTLPQTSKGKEYPSWNTKWENRNGRVEGRGDFVLGVRYWDHWGNNGCVIARLRLRN